MEYDRISTKQAAKQAVRQGDPKPWLVTLVYYLLAMIPGSILYFFLNLPNILSRFSDYYGGRGHVGFSAVILLFLYIVATLFSVVFQAGYTHYTMNLWRGRRTEVKDLFHCFHMAGKVICLSLLQAAYTLLWTLLGLLVLLPVIILTAVIDNEFLTVLISVLGTVGLTAFLFNRILRYALAVYVLLDHPDWGALDCLNESKALMLGRRWSFLLLCLSFLGWELLILAIIYGAMIGGTFIGAVIGTLAAPYMGFYAIFFWFFLALLAAFLVGIFCASPLILWLVSYMSTAQAGFYDCAAGYQSAPVEPDPPAGPYQRLGEPPAPDIPHFYHYGDGGSSGGEPSPPSSEPPSPKNADAQTGGFYSGFVQKEPEHKPEPPDSDSNM